MALDRENKALPYMTGRAIAIVEHHAQSHFGPNTLTTMFNTPEYSISVFMRYVPSDDSDWVEVAGTPFQKHLIPVEQRQAWIGYYHQKSELNKYIYRAEIGEKITELRLEKGYSIRKLAEMSGVDFANINKIEKGRYNVSIDILGKICGALDCRIDIVENKKI